MSAATCKDPTPVGTLIAYWLGELEGGAEAELEEHLFGCETCSARLQDVLQLRDGIRQVTRAGSVYAVVTADFIRRLRGAGMRVREYRLQPGGSVNCTVAPDDDLVIAHLHASLTDVHRLDLVLEDGASGGHWRAEDVAFDPAAGEVVMAPSVIDLRRLGVTTQHVQLVAVERDSERVLGKYTFHHSPHRGSPPR